MGNRSRRGHKSYAQKVHRSSFSDGRRRGTTMDDTYLINAAKTEFREAYNRGDVEQLLSVFDEEGFTDMSESAPTLYGQAAREGLRERATELFAQYEVKLTVIVIEIVVVGNL